MYCFAVQFVCVCVIAHSLSLAIENTQGSFFSPRSDETRKVPSSRLSRRHNFRLSISFPFFLSPSPSSSHTPTPIPTLPLSARQLQYYREKQIRLPILHIFVSLSLLEKCICTNWTFFPLFFCDVPVGIENVSIFGILITIIVIIIETVDMNGQCFGYFLTIFRQISWLFFRFTLTVYLPLPMLPSSPPNFHDDSVVRFSSMLFALYSGEWIEVIVFIYIQDFLFQYFRAMFPSRSFFSFF